MGVFRSAWGERQRTLQFVQRNPQVRSFVFFRLCLPCDERGPCGRASPHQSLNASLSASSCDACATLDKDDEVAHRTKSAPALCRIMPTTATKITGGQHTESAAIRTLLAHAGVANPLTGEPLSEVLCFGIAGGIGAGYSFCPSIPRGGIGSGVTIVGRGAVGSDSLRACDDRHDGSLVKLGTAGAIC